MNVTREQWDEQKRYQHKMAKFLKESLGVCIPCDLCDEKAIRVLTGKSGSIGVCRKCKPWWTEVKYEEE